MNKKVLFGALAVLAVVAVVLTAGCTSTTTDPSTTAKPTYIVGIDDYNPYSYTDESGNIVGFDVECMKWIANAEGYDVKFEYIDWDALTTYLASGKRDIICSGLSVNEERAKYMAFSDPYWSTSIDVVSLADKGYTLQNVYGGKLVIGVQAGCTADESLPDYLGEDNYNKLKSSGMIKNTYATFALAMEDLKNGRVDVVVFDNAGIKEQMNNNPGVFELVGSLEGSIEDFAAAVKIGNTDLLNKINDGYAKLKASPEWNILVLKYGLKNPVNE
ncbi:MAG TPA: transporter substrate-binding domain-containing protein [Methanocorpusculum sp.]|nr:transporter substrate-binding domain-containing protein [Methanocorpusculum sp.]